MGNLLPITKRGVQALHPVDLAHMRELHAVMVDRSQPPVRWSLYMLAAIVLVFVVWASLTSVDEVTRGNGKVVSSSGEQMIQSLEGGILSKLHVRQGDRVEAGQVLLETDPTKANAVYKEGLNKLIALQGSAARLRAEAYGTALVFPAELQRYPDVVRSETLAYNSRRTSLTQSVAELQHSLQMIEQEIALSEKLVARGLISDVEMLRMKRQVNDFQLQISDRQSKYRSEANAELSRVESELSQSRENVVARADTAKHTVFKSPVRGIVKNILISTIGGVIQPAATIMEIVPLDEKLLVEVKIRPQDVAFLHVGLPATVRVTAYDFSIYGGLQGEVEYISPDTLREESRTALAATGEETYYRVLVRTHESVLRVGEQTLPILPGMTTTADILSGKKSVLSYLLKPIFKAREALRER
jgi:adhesin transport system membrane fusion protein